MVILKKNWIEANKALNDANMELIAQQLTSLLDQYGINSKVLSDATGVSIALINNIKRGEGNPTIGTLNAICNFFNISLSELLDYEKTNTLTKNVKSVSIFDLRIANQRIEENISTKILIDTTKYQNSDILFGINISNNSFLPLYEKGTIFILDTSLEAVDGDIVVARIRDKNNALKRIFIQKDNYFLKNLNIDEAIENYDKSEIQILGVVSQIIQKIN